MKIDRSLNRIYAVANGYFWLPCPLCGEYYGGHEVGSIAVGVATGEPGIRHLVCNTCANQIMSRHQPGSVIDVDPVTHVETVRAYPSKGGNK